MQQKLTKHLIPPTQPSIKHLDGYQPFKLRSKLILPPTSSPLDQMVIHPPTYKITNKLLPTMEYTTCKLSVCIVDGNYHFMVNCHLLICMIIRQPICCYQFNSSSTSFTVLVHNLVSNV